jgi:hypothetical protein
VVNSGMEKQSIKRGPKRMTEKQLAANRRNASMAGRPANSMNAEKIAFRDRFPAKEVELADNLINLALHGKTEQVRLAATEGCSTGVGVGLPSRTTATGKVAQ